MSRNAGTPERRNFENRTLYQGDNLPFLRWLPDESVDLIATDPPFNKGRDFHATPDSLAEGASFEDRWRWIEDVQQEWVDAIERDWESVAWTIEAARKSSGEDMAAFLCWLGVRLIEMHRILKDTGSIYLHCDATASHYIKAIMDAVFGRKNFRNEIVWRKYAGRKNNASRKFTTQHEVLFFYAKSTAAKFNGVMLPHSEDEINKKYNLTDEDGRRYRLAWGRRYQLTGENRRIYLDESPGRAAGTLWVERTACNSIPAARRRLVTRHRSRCRSTGASSPHPRTPATSCSIRSAVARLPRSPPNSKAAVGSEWTSGTAH